MTDLPYPPPWQDLETLAKHVCGGEATIERLVRKGEFPPHKRMLGGKRLWKWEDVDRFLNRTDDTPSQQGESIREATSRLSRG